MKMVELRQKSTEELMILMREKQARLDELPMLFSRNKAKNVKEMAATKKDIARINTLLIHAKI